MKIVHLSLLALLCTWALPRQAHAQMDEEAARTHFEAGRQHYDSGAYEAALSEFEAAYRLSERVALLYNLYLTVERIGQLDRALDYLDRYIAEGEHTPERLAMLEQRRTNLRARIASAQTEPEPEPVAAPSDGGGDLVPAIVSFSVAGAGLIAFAIVGGLALAENDALASGCGVTSSCSDDDVSGLRTLNIVADVSWISAAVAATAGLVLLFTVGLSGGDEEADSQSVALAPWAGPSGGGLAAVGEY